MQTQISKENFKEIYENTYYKLFKFVVIKCNNIEDVNDIIQDTYIELLKKLEKKIQLNPEEIEKYIFGIANNVIKRHYYKKKKDNIISYYDYDENDIQIKDTFDLEQKIINKYNVKEVWDYVKTKDLTTIKIFYLYFVFGLKISEVSSELNINESTSKNKIYRTLKEIKKYFGKDVISND